MTDDVVPRVSSSWGLTPREKRKTTVSDNDEQQRQQQANVDQHMDESGVCSYTGLGLLLEKSAYLRREANTKKTQATSSSPPGTCLGSSHQRLEVSGRQKQQDSRTVARRSPPRNRATDGVMVVFPWNPKARKPSKHRLCLATLIPRPSRMIFPPAARWHG